MIADDEDDSVGGCRVSLDILEVGDDACSAVNWMTGCDGMLSVAAVGGSVDEDECTCSWGRRGSGVGERPLNLSHFAWSFFLRVMLPEMQE